MQAAGGIPVIMTLDPDIPHNEGCLRCVTVSAPLGSICNAEYPAATAAATTLPGDVMQDAVCRALAHAIPDKIRAGSAHWSNIPVCSGTDPRNEEVMGSCSAQRGQWRRRRARCRRMAADYDERGSRRTEDGLSRAYGALVPAAYRGLGDRAGLDGPWRIHRWPRRSRHCSPHGCGGRNGVRMRRPHEPTFRSLWWQPGTWRRKFRSWLRRPPVFLAQHAALHAEPRRSMGWGIHRRRRIW